MRRGREHPEALDMLARCSGRCVGFSEREWRGMSFALEYDPLNLYYIEIEQARDINMRQSQ